MIWSGRASVPAGKFAPIPPTVATATICVTRCLCNAHVRIRDQFRFEQEAAIRFVLSNHVVSVVVVGARTPSQAEENAHAADTLPYLPNDELAGIGGKLDAAGIEV